MNVAYEQQDSREYIHYFSFLRVISMLAVIVIHVISNTIYFYSNYLTDFQLFLGNFLHSFFQSWAVPIFVMISGALFLDKSKNISISKLYKKNILRLLLVLIVFGIVYALMELYFATHTLNLKMFFIALKKVYSNDVWDHMWFIYMLIGLYIVVPPVKIFINYANEKIIRYCLLVLFIFICIVPFIDSFTGIKFGIYIPISSVYFLYFLLGYSLHTDIIKIKPTISLFFILISVLWLCLCSLFFKNVEGFKYDNIVGIIMSTSIFSLSKKLCTEKNNWLDKNIVPLSFGVYIIHTVFINLIYKIIHFTPKYYNVYFVWFVTFIVVLFSSLLFVLLLRKIPFIRKWLL